MQSIAKLMGCKPSNNGGVTAAAASPSAAKVATNRAASSHLPVINKSFFITAGILGEGGFGKVMTGMLIKNGTWYAIKEIKKKELVKHKCGIPMIFGELHAMKRCNHPSAINLHFAFQDRRKCFFVLDLKTGGDLRYYLRRRHLFEEMDVAFYVACISSALDHIHSKNIIHRDVKPENIILDERGYPYLTDFGVSYVHEPASAIPGIDSNILACNLASGTKQYLAPEVFTKNHLHGPEADFWSLGVVAYELIFGKRPFDKHVPVNFINYLEKALSLKRKSVKEMKMRQLAEQQEAAAAGAVGGNGHHAASAGHMSTASSSDNLPAMVLSPIKHAGGGYREPSPLARTPSNSGKLQSGSSGVPVLSPLRSSSPMVSCPASPLVRTLNNNHANNNSSSEYNTRDRDTQNLSFCSSVGYTQDQQMLSPQKGGGMRGASPVVTSNESSLDYGVSLSLRDSRDRGSFGQVTASSPSKGNGIILPELKSPHSGNGGHSPSHNNNTNNGNSANNIPRPLFRSSLFSSSSPSNSGKNTPMQSMSVHEQQQQQRGVAGIGCAGGGDGSDGIVFERDIEANFEGGNHHHHGGNGSNKAESEGGSTEEENEDEENASADSSMPRAKPGDHWLVDDGFLHPALLVEIPDTNPWIGLISPECQRVLSGFFDVRPSHRLGGRNMHILRKCRWFETYKYTNWEEMIQAKTYSPHFQPGKRFIKDCLERMDDLAQAQFLGGCDTNDTDSNNQLCDVATDLSPEQEEAFESFVHIADEHRMMFSLSGQQPVLGDHSKKASSYQLVYH